MSIINISMNQALIKINRANASSDDLGLQAGTGKKINEQQDNPPLPAKTEARRPEFGQRQAINADRNALAASIRVADSSMKTIGDYIDRMKAQLETIVKTYPPFPPGSEDRVRLLKSYSAFRKQIDELTIPPRDEGAAQIMADPAVLPQAGKEGVPVDENGPRGTVRSQQVHTGPTGLDIPALTDTAADGEIRSAIGSLDAARATLSQRSAGLSEDAAGIARSQEYNARPGEVRRDTNGKQVFAVLTDGAAEQTSVDLRRSLAQEQSRGLTEMRPLLSQLLR